METLIGVTLTPEKGNKTVLGAEDAILLVSLHPIGFQTAIWMDKNASNILSIQTAIWMDKILLAFLAQDEFISSVGATVSE